MRILASFVAAAGAALLMSAPPEAEAPSATPLTERQVLAALPAGVTLGWYGGAEVPDGFTLCDGTGGTPDLVGRFPLGTANPMEIGSKTGSASHDLRPPTSARSPFAVEAASCGQSSSRRRDGMVRREPTSGP